MEKMPIRKVSQVQDRTSGAAGGDLKRAASAVEKLWLPTGAQRGAAGCGLCLPDPVNREFNPWGRLQW